MCLVLQRRIQQDFDIADAVSAPKLWHLKNKEQNKKTLLKLKVTGKCLECRFRQCKSMKCKNFWPLSPQHSGGLPVTLTSSFCELLD